MPPHQPSLSSYVFETWSSPTTRRPCRQACTVCTCQPPVLSKCGLPAVAHLTLMMCASSRRSYSVQATFIPHGRPAGTATHGARGSTSPGTPFSGSPKGGGSPSSSFFTLRRLAEQNLGRSGAPRPPNPIRTRSRAIRPLGRLDSDRRPPGGVRATVGRVRSPLAGAHGHAGQRG